MESEEIRVYNHPNPHIKSFLTTTAIWPYRVACFRRPLREISEQEKTDIGLVSAQLLREVMEIQGVSEVFIKPKEIRLKKEVSAWWPEIERRVIGALERALRKKKIKAVK